jgi:hypothetical protein
MLVHTITQEVAPKLPKSAHHIPRSRQGCPNMPSRIPRSCRSCPKVHNRIPRSRRDSGCGIPPSHCIAALAFARAAVECRLGTARAVVKGLPPWHSRGRHCEGGGRSLAFARAVVECRNRTARAVVTWLQLARSRLPQFPQANSSPKFDVFKPPASFPPHIYSKN